MSAKAEFNVEEFAEIEREAVAMFARHVRAKIDAGAEGYEAGMERLSLGEWLDQYQSWQDIGAPGV